MITRVSQITRKKMRSNYYQDFFLVESVTLALLFNLMNVSPANNGEFRAFVYHLELKSVPCVVLGLFIQKQTFHARWKASSFEALELFFL